MAPLVAKRMVVTNACVCGGNEQCTEQDTEVDEEVDQEEIRRFIFEASS